MTNLELQDAITCSYCGAMHENTPKILAEHILDCDKRPEARLLIKMQILEDAGDALLSVIHSLVKALAEIEGMRTGAWEIFRVAQEKWEITKNLSIENITAVTAEDYDEQKESTPD